MTTDIYLLGSGIRGSLQFTEETRQALSVCTTAFILHPDLMVHEHVKAMGPAVIDLADLYDGKEVRQDVYTEISERLVDAARTNGPVAFVVHGHPLFLVSASEYTLDLAAKNNLTATALPAVSSFDTLMCDLGIDYGYGIQIFDSTTMLREGWLPNPRVPTLIFQLPTTNNANVVLARPTSEVLAPLVAALESVYGGDHPVQLVHSGAHLLEGTRIDHTALGKLAIDEFDLHDRPTLYLESLA